MYVQAPNFGFGIERVVISVPQSRISPEDARIRVQNPSTQSSAMGIRGHTLYEIFRENQFETFRLQTNARTQTVQGIRVASRTIIKAIHRSCDSQITRQEIVRKHGSSLYRGETNGASTVFELHSSTSSHESMP